jgi:hypothetical protein
VYLHIDTAIDFALGGLLIDFGILTPKLTLQSLANTGGVPCLLPSHGAIVEWRAMTVIELYVIMDVPKIILRLLGRDRIADGIRCLAGVDSYGLTLAQVLESATWKGGREIARQLRPLTGGPPIEIESDGTVF